MLRMRYAAILLALPLAACASVPATSSIERFWSALRSHCGNAYAGALVSEDARDEDFRGRQMVAHWAECSEYRVAIAFHIEDPDLGGGWDRSRTWVVTRRDFVTGGTTGLGALELRHDHRHQDGSEDAVTQYGGITGLDGSALAQDFPVNPSTIALFEREGLGASLTNVWRMEVDPARDPDARFAYQLTRENDPTRLFRVEFDATDPVEPPPAAWGW